MILIIILFVCGLICINTKIFSIDSYNEKDLRMITMAVLTYSSDNNGQFPNEIRTLINFTKELSPLFNYSSFDNNKSTDEFTYNPSAKTNSEVLLQYKYTYIYADGHIITNNN